MKYLVCLLTCLVSLSWEHLPSAWLLHIPTGHWKETDTCLSLLLCLSIKIITDCKMKKYCIQHCEYLLLKRTKSLDNLLTTSATKSCLIKRRVGVTNWKNNNIFYQVWVHFTVQLPHKKIFQSLHLKKVPREDPGFCSMEQLKVLLLFLDGKLVHHKLHPPSLPLHFIKITSQLAMTNL